MASQYNGHIGRGLPLILTSTFRNWIAQCRELVVPSMMRHDWPSTMRLSWA